MTLIFTTIFFLIDISSKYIISKIVTLGNSIDIIKNFLRISYVKNTGAAFSILDGNTLFVTIIGIVIIIMIIWYLYKNKVNKMIDKIGYSLILGGSIGNLFDRVCYGYVRDFIGINIFGYHFPIFNIADMSIVIGVILLVIATVKGDVKNGTFSRRRKFKNR